ncbi:heme-binding protein [Rickettsiales bacterium]|nr:heme-binding protein [Rickettsiales bacterium]
MKKKWIISSMLGILICYAMIGQIMSDVEYPSYEAVSSVKNIEIRQYAPMIIAEVEVQGERKKAIEDGFRLLADYIFGNNVAQQNIAMTAPVQQQSSGEVWKVSFVMPSEYSMAALPKPNNDLVMLSKIPAKQFIAIKFSGTNSNENIARHEEKLLQYIEENQIQITGSPKYAFYNPPWTLPFMRRNEVMIEVQR